MPTFDHSFDPAADAPAGVGSLVNLSTREVEAAGLLEVLQAPGASLGSWAIFDALLEPTSSKFLFREPLGQSREVKTALSGLFGRFVARAYLTRHLGYSEFVHVTKPPMRLARVANARLVRLHRGDMPDWVLWHPTLRQLAIAEAKGCHDRKGPDAALQRAWIQANRADVEVNGARVPLKRFAIASRWGIAASPAMDPQLFIKDPEETDRKINESDRDQLELGMVRRHYAALLRGLGFDDLSEELFALTELAPSRTSAIAQVRAKNEFDKLHRRDIKLPADVIAPEDTLVGGFVTRAGPTRTDVEITVPESEALSKVGLRPSFVGIETQRLAAAIDGNTELLKTLRAERRSRRKTKVEEANVGAATATEGEEEPHDDGGGVWSIRIDVDKARIS